MLPVEVGIDLDGDEPGEGSKYMVVVVDCEFVKSGSDQVEHRLVICYVAGVVGRKKSMWIRVGCCSRRGAN